MINEQLVGYVLGERARGVADEAIKAALVAQGWKQEDIIAAVGGVGAVASGPRALSFENLFEGRIGRWQYFLTSLLLGVAVMVVAFLVGTASRSLGGMSFLLLIAAYIFVIPLSISLSVRRAHDMNWSGWYVLFMLVPFVNFVFALIFLFKVGTPGSNIYGLPQGDRNFKDTLLNL